MEDFIINNIFISFIIGLMWVFFLCLLMAETDLFGKNLIRVIGTTIFLIGTNASIKMQRLKREKIKESIRLEEKKDIQLNLGKTTKRVGNKYVAKYLLKFCSILFGIAAIITIVAFHIRKIELTTHYFFTGILVFSVCELIIGSIVGGIVTYTRECKKEGFLKTTLYVIFMLILAACLVYNKNSRWF